MKYYIPTSSLNFNNILSTESISPKVFYEKRGFGYSRWWSIDENNIENITLLFDSPHQFERPSSDIEDHEMLIEINTNDEYNKITDGVYYSDKTIYLNPWQTKIYFFSDSVKRTVLSLSDSSLETKMVRLYQRQIIVASFDGKYPIIRDGITVNPEDTNTYIEEDYIINKMKGLLYGYYIGANLSSTKEQIRKLDSLREIQNIFSSVVSSYDKVPSLSQRNRLNELFDFLEHQQPLYLDLEKEVGSQEIVNRLFDVLKRYGYSFQTIDRNTLITGLQSDKEHNPSIIWIKKEISKAESLIGSSKKLLNPENAEIIVSSKEKLVSQKAISDKFSAKLFIYWVNNVLCSNSFNGKINSLKESLSDEITKDAKNIIGVDWDNSPVRTYLNQLRRHIRGEEFNQEWNNGLLSSMAAVLIKGDEWEQLLYFMQNKGMYDYRLAYAIYGVLNGFANLTRDFTDLLLNQQSRYLADVYCEFYGQLHEKIISNEIIRENVTENDSNKGLNISSVPQKIQNVSINQWRHDILSFASSIIKRDKKKLLKSLEEALGQNGENQDYFIFMKTLKDFEGWRPGKKGPSAVWKRMQENYVLDYDQRIEKERNDSIKNKGIYERTLFDIPENSIQQSRDTCKNGFSRIESKHGNKHSEKDNNKFLTTNHPSSKEVSILKDTSWIEDCASMITNTKASKQFITDMGWFVENHGESYHDKKKNNRVRGHYWGHDTSNKRVLERLRAYMENKLTPKNEKMKWLAGIYTNIPINKIMDHLYKIYGR